MSGYSGTLIHIYNHYSDTLPKSLLHRLWSSLRHLYWALFGLIDLEDFSNSNSYDRDSETAVGKIILALWLLLSVIILLNMLIALVTKAFEDTQVSHSSLKYLASHNMTPFLYISKMQKLSGRRHMFE